ncbi:MAG: hypothetical protein ABIW79_06000 [Gemmatimonas sp.]
MIERPMLVQRLRRGEEDSCDQVYLSLSPAERMGMMWQLALDAWTFTGHHQPESRLSRHTLVIQRRTR